MTTVKYALAIRVAVIVGVSVVIIVVIPAIVIAVVKALSGVIIIDVITEIAVVINRSCGPNCAVIIRCEYSRTIGENKSGENTTLDSPLCRGGNIINISDIPAKLFATVIVIRPNPQIINRFNFQTITKTIIIFNSILAAVMVIISPHFQKIQLRNVNPQVCVITFCENATVLPLCLSSVIGK